MAEIVTLSPGRPDAEVAGELRAEAIALLKPICELMDRAKAGGFVLNFAINQDMFGRTTVTGIQIAKNF